MYIYTHIHPHTYILYIYIHIKNKNKKQAIAKNKIKDANSGDLTVQSLNLSLRKKSFETHAFSCSC